jgi:hypothetical protein
MKQTLFILGISFFIALTACNSQSDASKKAKQVQTAIKENKPGTVATTAEGYTMRAKLDGKEWTATAMMPPETAGRIIGYMNAEYIGLPYDKGNLVSGKKNTFGEDNAVDLSTNDAGMLGGRKGEMQITKVDENWVEGTFFFTAGTSGSNKTVEVTDGFFRIPSSGK